jgi:hypothetical protein
MRNKKEIITMSTELFRKLIGSTPSTPVITVKPQPEVVCAAYQKQQDDTDQMLFVNMVMRNKKGVK